MGRTYKNYYVLVPIKVLVQYPEPILNSDNNTFFEISFLEEKDEKDNPSRKLVPRSVPGEMYFGSRFSTLLLETEGVLQALQIVSEETAYDKAPGCAEPITAVKLSTQSDAIKIGVFSLYSFTLVPADPAHIIAPYNLKYSTRIPASGNLDPKTVAHALYALPFKITNNDEFAIYTVVPNSVKKVGSKKFSGTIPLL